jgi:hypothetical protein
MLHCLGAFLHVQPELKEIVGAAMSMPHATGCSVLESPSILIQKGRDLLLSLSLLRMPPSTPQFSDLPITYCKCILSFESN